jgi:hypothetical protein
MIVFCGEFFCTLTFYYPAISIPAKGRFRQIYFLAMVLPFLSEYSGTIIFSSARYSSKYERTFRFKIIKLFACG